MKKKYYAKKGDEIVYGTVDEISEKIGYAVSTVHQACDCAKRLDGWAIGKVEYRYVGFVNDRLSFSGGIGDLVNWLGSVGVMTYQNGGKIIIESEW